MCNLKLKRMFDIIFSCFCILVSLPIWAIISFLVYIEDRGPIYYLQDRIGKDGKVFRAIKFRSMIPKAEETTGPIQAKIDDPRSTRIGKILRRTALDELPQLINILKGEMSFVGPRALRPDEIEVGNHSHTYLITRPEANQRNKVTPGLTGVAQLYAPRDIPFKYKLKYDIWYINHSTFFLDLWLIFASFFVTFLARWESRAKKLPFLHRPIGSLDN